MIRLTEDKICASKKNYTYNMAENQFLAKNKEIFRHGSFVGKSVPYLFLLLGLCSAVCLQARLYGFVTSKLYSFFMRNLGF